MYYILEARSDQFFKKPVPSVLFAEEDLVSVAYDLHTLGVEVSELELEQVFVSACENGRATAEYGGYFVQRL